MGTYALLLSGLTLLVSVGIVMAAWWLISANRAVRSRLAGQGGEAPSEDLATIVSQEQKRRFPLLAEMLPKVPWGKDLALLTEQAGLPGQSGAVTAGMILGGVLGMVIGIVRMGSPLLGLGCGVVGAAIPIIYLRVKRQKRMAKFSQQFPDALDMVTRSLQAGFALSAALQVVAEDMPDPVGSEFKQVTQEITLGRAPHEALLALHERIPTEEIRFFLTSVNIQRDVGGNLAEILGKLSNVIRERFKLLSYARVLSAQHRASAYCISASPVVLAIIFAVLSPGYFDAMFKNPMTLFGMQLGRALVMIGLVFQVVGFAVIRRIADIKV